jgi:hypothetical protein
MEDKSKIEKIVKEAKDLLSVFEEIKTKSEINNSSLFFKYLDRVSVAKFIVPYLELKDIVNFRTTCKDVNASVSSTVAMVSYYKSINNKKSGNSNLTNMFLKPFNELNDSDDIQMEMESIKKVKNIICK